MKIQKMTNASRLKYKLASLFYTLMLLSLTLTACGTDSSKPSSISINDAPHEIATIYKAKCINCHGTELQGRVGPSTNLQQIGARMTAEDIMTRIEEGKGSMPSFKESLSDEEIEKLASWLAGNK